MTISVICPIYNGSQYIESLHSSLKRQNYDDKICINYLLTKSDDNSKQILDSIGASYEVIEKEEFSHSLSRENAAFNAEGDIIIFITQDIEINDNQWIEKLTRDIKIGNCEAAFSRQVSNDNSIEKYTRLKNYPLQSRIASKENENELGVMAYFYSDAASAIKKSVFVELNGYDGKNLITNEDMYIAYKLIKNGYRIKYCAESVVNHSHKYSYKTLFKRYFDQGVFLKQHEYIKKSGANSSALELFKFIIYSSLKEGNIKVFLEVIPNFMVRFLGNKFGSRYEKLSKEKILKYTANKNYWV